MKKTYLNLAIALTALAMASCGGGDDPITPDPVTPDKPSSPDDVEVTISTSEIETKANVSTVFKSADKMNIFAKTYNRIDAPNIVDDVVATFDGNKWTMKPAVKINPTQKNAFVYAVAPYDATYIDAQKIPVDVNKQVDLLYSGSYVPASLTSPAVKLNMKHALALMTFNIVPFNYSGSGALTGMKLDGDLVHADGTMDASTGKITKGSVGAIDVKFNKNVSAGGWKADLPGIWVIPFNTKAGTANLAVTIGGRTYNLTVPEVEMKTGYQYIFRLVLTDNGLEFDPSKTETISLNVDTDDAVDFKGYGCLKFTIAGNSWMSMPTFTGDAVFGSVKDPNRSFPYQPSAELTGLKDGDVVIVETWNSNGFKLEMLDGVGTIDISQFE